MNPKVLSANDIERMKDVLSYSPDTGIFTWAKKTNRSVVIGRTAGNRMPSGHIAIEAMGVRVLAHRLAWAFVYGHDVPPLIDHINRNASDNRIANLRQADKSLNALNTDAQGRGASGLRGVSCNARRGGFDVAIKAGKKLKYIGHFACERAAHAAYLDAKSNAMQEMCK